MQALLEQNRLMEELVAESHATGKKLRCLEARSDLYAGCLRDEDRQREIRKEMERSDRRGTIYRAWNRERKETDIDENVTREEEERI